MYTPERLLTTFMTKTLDFKSKKKTMNWKPNRVKICYLQNMLVSEKKEKSAILSFKV